MLQIINRLRKTINPVESALTETLPSKLEPKHMHSWEIVARTYAPPRTDVQTQGVGEKSLEKAMFGLTTLLWECPKCGETKKEEMLGSDSDTLEELISKVQKTGPQFVELGGETYVFNKWVPASATPGTIPLR